MMLNNEHKSLPPTGQDGELVLVLLNKGPVLARYVRELEGALKRVAANAKFAKTEIDINLVKDSLRDVLAIQAKMVTIGNIQRVVAD